MNLSACAFGAILALITQSAIQAANPPLVFTELSSTELTVTLDGVPTGIVNNVAPDVWVWDSGVTIAGLIADIKAPGWFDIGSATCSRFRILFIRAIFLRWSTLKTRFWR